MEVERTNVMEYMRGQLESDDETECLCGNKEM